MKVKTQWRKHRALLTAILENMMTFGKAGIIKVLLALDILIVLAALLLERKQYSKKNISLVSDICLYPDSYSVPWLCYWYLVSAESGDLLFFSFSSLSYWFFRLFCLVYCFSDSCALICSYSSSSLSANICNPCMILKMIKVLITEVPP